MHVSHREKGAGGGLALPGGGRGLVVRMRWTGVDIVFWVVRQEVEWPAGGWIGVDIVLGDKCSGSSEMGMWSDTAPPPFFSNCFIAFL